MSIYGKCTRTTKAGKPCKRGRMLWPSEIPLPDPESCRGHLTKDEDAAWLVDAPRREVEAEMLFWPRTSLYISDPACWSWEPPTPADLERLCVVAEVAALPQRVAEALYALLERTRDLGGGPLTTYEVCEYDSNARIPGSTYHALDRARQRKLVDGHRGLWFATNRGHELRGALEDRVLGPGDGG